MPPLRHPGPPRAVHEPLGVPLPPLPAHPVRPLVRRLSDAQARALVPGEDHPGYPRPIVDRLRHFLFVRHGHNWILLLRFGLVGGSGVLVNLLTTVVVRKLGPDEDGIALGLPLTDFNIRWYHVFSTVAFLVANLWNFQLNRRFTFRSTQHSGWFREYFPFLAVGFLGQLVGLGILTLLMHPGSFLASRPGVSTTPPASARATTGRSSSRSPS